VSRPLALVIHAHPDPASFSAALADRAVSGLRSGGWDVERIDLYQEGFRADMSTEERREYHGPDPLRDPLTRRSAELVSRCEALVFVYPTWWWGLPAIAKGWIERVLVNGVAFELVPGGGVRPKLHQVRRIVGVTTYGSRRIELMLTGDAGRRLVTRTLRTLCGRRTSTTWIGLYGLDRVRDQRRRAFLDRVEAAMVRL
jgi:NAD(P)H dehydrogenase (quinone)